MADFATVTLNDGTEVVFETAESSSANGGSSTLSSQPIPVDRLSALANAANQACLEFRNQLSPDEITLEVAIGLSGEVGWFFAKSKIDASITVSLKWSSTATEG